jgi:hypothetical protein
MTLLHTFSVHKLCVYTIIKQSSDFFSSKTQAVRPIWKFSVDGRGDMNIIDRGHPMQFTLSFGESPWFDEHRRLQLCDWLGISHNLEIWTGTTQKCECDFPSQSQGCIMRRTSNHGISPNDSVNYSGCPLPQNTAPIYKPPILQCYGVKIPIIILVLFARKYLLLYSYLLEKTDPR